MLLKMQKIIIEDNPSIFVPSIRQELYNYLTTSLTKDDRVKYFQTEVKSLEFNNVEREKNTKACMEK